MRGNPIVLEEPTPPKGGRRPERDELWQKYCRSSQGSSVENELVQQYLPLVKTVVGRLARSLPSHVSGEDLYSAGLVGLLNALRNYDAKIGTAFQTYARLRIRGAIFDELRRMDWVPRSVHDKSRKVQAAMQQLEQASGKVPTLFEVAKALKISPAEYEQWLEEIRPVTFICLDAVTSSENGEGHTQYESIMDDTQEDPMDATSRRELARLIAQRLNQLPEMQRKVLALYYFEDMRLREIAEAFSLTESRICQIHAQAILSIKSYLRKQDILPR